MGYGLDDLAHQGFKLIDPRINLSSPAWDYNMDVEDYAKWLEATPVADEFDMDLDRWTLRDRSRDNQWKPDMNDCYAYSPEYGLANVLVLRPLATKDWSRYDDPLDYVSETFLYCTIDGPTSKVEPLGLHTLHPFEAFMDKRTGEKIDDRIYSWVREVNGGGPAGGPPSTQSQLDRSAQRAGFADHADALENVAPMVPVEVRNLCKYMEIFTSEDTCLTLRPMIYTYWS
jgi:hypothetical protein